MKNLENEKKIIFGITIVRVIASLSWRNFVLKKGLFNWNDESMVFCCR